MTVSTSCLRGLVTVSASLQGMRAALGSGSSDDHRTTPEVSQGDGIAGAIVLRELAWTCHSAPPA